MYTRLWVRVKIFCCDRNGALSKKLHGCKKIKTFAKFAKCYREKFHKLASSSTG
jgi:hypothetical protein